MNLSIVILAAGQGKRMRSDLPKVLHTLGGVTFLERVVNTAQSLNPKQILVVYGNGGAQVRDEMAHLCVKWVEQKHALGTGHALMQALPHLDKNDRILVLYGDVPLISRKTLEYLLETTPQNALGLLVAEFDDPTGLGRIARDAQGNIAAIIEQKDANEVQLKIKEVNTGILTGSVAQFAQWLPKLKNQNSQKEYYLTDVIAMAVASGCAVNGIFASCHQEVRGVNTLSELISLERYYQYNNAQELIAKGVMILDPHRIDIRGTLDIDPDVVIDVNVVMEEKVSIGAHSMIGPNVFLRNVQIGAKVKIEANCVIENAIIEDEAIIGPFARIRPGTHIAKNAHIGNFVEVKNSYIGENTKANHLSYLGDAQLGKNVNIGAGVITVNYDGADKHPTYIKDNAFVGCDSQLIAPVTVGKGAYIAAGSTITQDAPSDQLTIARARQSTIKNWKPPKKKS